MEGRLPDSPDAATSRLSQGFKGMEEALLLSGLLLLEQEGRGKLVHKPCNHRSAGQHEGSLKHCPSEKLPRKACSSIALGWRMGRSLCASPQDEPGLPVPA